MGDSGGGSGARAGSSPQGGAGNGRGGAGGSAHQGLAGADSGEAGAGGGEPEATLDVYWVDVEGGGATIIKTPDGKVLLVDAGHPGGRDAFRILTVLEREVEAERIDHLIVSHYHPDHLGGVAEVAAGIDVVEFIDHGEPAEEGAADAYFELASERRRSVSPGEKIELGDVTLTIVQAHGQPLAEPLGEGELNPACDDAEPSEEDAEPLEKELTEDDLSVGYMLKFGDFEFLDLGDLTAAYAEELACPRNLLGSVELVELPRHSAADAMPKALLSALSPLVAVVSNGIDKDLDADAYEQLFELMGLEALWATHRPQVADAELLVEDRFANLESGAKHTAHFLRARVAASGAFSLENSRIGYREAYEAR